MSTRLLFRYARGLAYVVVIAALTACGAGPATGPDPVQIQDVKFGQDEKVRKIYLGDKFTGKDLTYAATSDKPAVATAKVEKATLTVTAVGPGTAKITVTAENSQGEAEQTFTVTVPPATDPGPDPGPGGDSEHSVSCERYRRNDPSW